MKKRKIIKQIVCLSLTLVGLIGMSEKVIAEEIQDYDIQSIIKEDVIEQTLEQKNSVMGSSMSNNQVLSTFSLGKSLNASDATLPNKDFIDVSSWNGALTVDQYKKMKSYGVKGVVVKLSEGDYYVNPQRFIQIKNAQTAGLTVSAYHYSKFSTEAGAKKEANYFVNAISNTGLLKNVTLVNDAEDSSMVSGHVTNNSIIFANTLKSHGYSNVVHYSMASWITGGNPKLNPSVLGKSNIWVAQYPYTPNKNNLLHSDYAAWQWASDLTFSGVTTPIGGNFDINMDYLGRFTNKTYDSIEKEVKTSFKAKIKESLISEKHGLWDDVYNTHEGIRSLGKGSKFANKNVTISATVKTSRSTYWKFTVDGINYWMDMAAFTPTLYTVQKSEQVNYTVVVKPNSESAKQGIWTAPWNTTLDGKYLGHGGTYAGKTVQVSRIVTLNTGSTYYEFTVNGKLIGWLDTQAFYEPIIEEYATNYRATITNNATNQGVWSAPYNTKSGINGYGKGQQYIGRTVSISKVVKTSRSTYLQTSIDGKNIWIDQKAFTPALYTIQKSEQVNYTVVVKPNNESAKQGIWTAPWNTTLDGKYLGHGGTYAGKTVQVSRIVTLNTGSTYYEFTVNGKLIGWLDAQAFYEPIIEEYATSYRATITNNATNQGVWSAPYNTKSGINGYGKGQQYIGRTVSISKVVKTSRSTYLQTNIDGKNIWIDQKAFTPALYTIQKSEQVNYTVVVKPNSESAKQGIWTAPWNTTLDGKYLGHGGMYAGKTVQVSRIVTLNTGSTYYEFTVNGKLIGWLDAQAFYEPIIEEIDVNYSVEIVDSAKNQGAWSAPYNTESNIIGYGKGSQYVGQQGTVDKIVRTTRSGYWRVTLDGKTFWLDEVSFKKVVKKATIDISDENESDTIDSSQSETEESIIDTSETSEPSNKDGIVESSDNIENIMEQTSSDSIIDSEEVMESTVD